MEQSQDQIWGFVRQVHDGDTLTLAVTSQSGKNQYEYRDTEKVRLKDTNAPELGTRGAQAAKRRLSALVGKRVRCNVFARDKHGRIVCIVVPAPSDYAN